MKLFTSHGDGRFTRKSFKHLGDNVIFEPEVLIFHPENIEIGDNVYIGHRTILKGYFRNTMSIGNNVWIGQNCFLHSGGGITIEDSVGIGPFVKLLTLSHEVHKRTVPIIERSQKYAPIYIKTGCDIGIGAILLPGVTIGKYSQIGAGAVVTKNIPEFSVAVGIPAKVLNKRM